MAEEHHVWSVHAVVELGECIHHLHLEDTICGCPCTLLEDRCDLGNHVPDLWCSQLVHVRVDLVRSCWVCEVLQIEPGKACSMAIRVCKEAIYHNSTAICPSPVFQLVIKQVE